MSRTARDGTEVANAPAIAQPSLQDAAQDLTVSGSILEFHLVAVWMPPTLPAYSPSSITLSSSHMSFPDGSISKTRPPAFGDQKIAVRQPLVFVHDIREERDFRASGEHDFGGVVTSVDHDNSTRDVVQAEHVPADGDAEERPGARKESAFQVVVDHRISH